MRWDWIICPCPERPVPSREERHSVSVWQRRSVPGWSGLRTCLLYTSIARITVTNSREMSLRSTKTMVKIEEIYKDNSANPVSYTHLDVYKRQE